ncbi:MAG TPA: hypothetical protein VN631_15660 [Negativicutes bacterium]|nr:hypothetical protein [Negativicutes bacterium]
MRSLKISATILCLMMSVFPLAEVQAARGNWDSSAARTRPSASTRERQQVPPPGKTYQQPVQSPGTSANPTANPKYRPPATAPGYRPLPAYPPNWRPPHPLPPGGYRPAYPPPPGYRPYPPPPGMPAGVYPPSYYPGYRPPVLVYPYQEYTTGQVVAGALFIGMVIAALSDSAEPTVVNNNTYYYDGEYYYEPMTDGMETVYKVVEPPQYE